MKWNPLQISPFLRFLIPHLATVHNLSRRFLHLLKLRNEVPEPGLGNNVVRREDPHAVERWGPTFRRGQAPPDHFIFPQLERNERQSRRQRENLRAAAGDPSLP